MQSTPSFANHLKNEKSPYLLQHVHNPVDWYPWGSEALKKAQQENKPILLSIGYSTCHWCHVMAHESFENETIAKKINEYFIPIKVDREERPDLDQVYMSSVTAMTGQGGWPLTVFLTPDQKPFFGGTYFPPAAKWGSPGFIDVLESVHRAWQSDPKKLIDSSETLVSILKERVEKQPTGLKLTPQIFEQGFSQFQGMYDERFGGFGHQPKFPSSHNLSFLLRYWRKENNQEAYQMVMHTLNQMGRGGMYDHIGGGFHRYSTDETWQIPHFEKMLYDQAILTITYLESYQITKSASYEKIVREICDYVIRDMQSKEGGFFSAEDADSLDPYDPQSDHKKEGAYYLWTQDHLEHLLGKDAEIFIFYYGVAPQGNARLDPHQEFAGRNVISAEHTIEETALQFGKSVEDIEHILKRSKEILFKERKTRVRPHLDDKVLTDWNALMISALAQSGAVLNEKRYLEAAQKAADFILSRLMTKEGRLLHRYRDGEAAMPGNLDDYAFLINALLDLYEAGFEIAYLQTARRLTDEMIRLFWDPSAGGFYFIGTDAEALIMRQKEIYDGAMPSGNSMAALGLLRIYHTTFSSVYIEKAEKVFSAFAGDISQHPSAYAQMLSAFDYFTGPSMEIVLAGAKEDKNFKEMLKIIYNTYLPNKVLIFNEIRHGKPNEALVSFAPLVKDQTGIKDKLTAYVCVNHVCQLPATDAEEVKKILNNPIKANP